MIDKNLVTEFNQGFDLIINGDFKGLNIKNEENRSLLGLVGKIRKVDFSGDSKIGDSLKRQLLEKLQDDGQLSDMELDWAAGGLDDLPKKNDPEK